MAPRAKPYRFTELERWTRSQLLILKTLIAYLPGAALGDEFKASIKELLARLTGSEVDIWLDSMTVQDGAEVARELSEPACLALISMLPSEHHAVLDLDLKLAGIAVDKMLGGTGEDADPSRPLSSIESGLVSFILLKLMSVAQGLLAEEQEVALRLKKLHAHPDGVREALEGHDLVVVGFKVFLDMQVGYVRLVLPAEMVRTTLATAVEPGGPVWERRLASLRQRLARVASAPTQLVVEAGRSELSSEDLAGVDVGDILLVEKTGVRKEGESLSGEVEVRVGAGTHGVVRGNLVDLENGHQGVEITAIEAFPEPDPAGMEAGGAEDGGEPAQEEEQQEEYAEEARHTPLRPGGSFPRGEQAREGAFGALVRARGVGGDVESRDEETVVLRAELGEDQRDDEDEEMQDEEYEEQQDEEAPSEEGGEEAQEEGPQDNLGETEALLKDIPMPVVVELGRIKTSAGDIVNLRAGQILELRRAPNDPVDITVNGKLVGKGELVEVDGELGVRLLSLVR
ncbi:MAG: FliM/FliN family flagellar motor switch protein [Myxococcota bacterium]